MMDACAPATAIGYAVGRIGCLVSGDGDYGKPTTLPWGMAFPNGLVPTTETCVQWGAAPDCRVHPTPIYEFLVGVAIFYYLWRLGDPARRANHPRGYLVGLFFILSGAERFLVEFIRINPRSIFGVMSNAQFVGLLCFFFGIALMITLRKISPSAIGSAR